MALFALLLCCLLVQTREEPARKAIESELQLSGYGGVIDEKYSGTGNRTFQSIQEKDGLISSEYGFLTFSGTPLRILFSTPVHELETYRGDYGYTRQDLDTLAEWQKKALADAYRQAMMQRHSQAQLDRAAKEIKNAYREKRMALLRSRGFRFRSDEFLLPDIPGIVQRNIPKMRPVALSLQAAAAKSGSATDTIVGAALSLVQTALVYETIPLENEGRVTGGILPPMQAMAEGKGDCDSKTTLLGSILLNWDKIRLVGVGLPDHYLMGILGNPGKGEAFVEYEGLTYILMEPAGPAWLPPGIVSPATLEMLGAGRELTVEPLPAN